MLESQEEEVKDSNQVREIVVELLGAISRLVDWSKVSDKVKVRDNVYEQSFDIHYVEIISKRKFLEEFKNSVESFTKAANKIKKKEIEFSVKKEISSMLINKLDNKENE